MACGRLAKTVFDPELIINERPVALARTFFHDAPLVILDEPTAGCDAKPGTSCSGSRQRP
jgi:alpha-D-ribose 1-methylphosphonate 5-triphosphate synthase subunit PhnL